MKRILLTSASMLIAAVGFAQSSIETAVDMKKGDNQFTNEQATERSNAYWKYTSTQDEAIIATAINSSNLMCYMLDENGQQKQIEGSSYTTFEDGKSNVATVFPAPKGKTVYICANGYQVMGFNADIEDSPNVMKGSSENDWAEIIPGKMQLFYNGDNWRTEPVCATYTPDKDGVLKITSYANVNYATDEAGVQYTFDYDRDKYVNVGAIKVTGGRENKIKIYSYGPIYFSSEMTYPQPGSYEMPFSIAEGANAVPKAEGTYWYTVAVGEDGMLNITSTDALTDGQLSLYSSTYNVSANRPDAQSVAGSYNLTYAVKANTTYYIKVEKKGTEAEQSFNYNLKAYEDGDTEDKPIYITDFSQTFSVPAGATKYYAVSLNANEKKNLTVAATSEVKDANTQVSVYQYSYSAVNGNASVTTVVDGGYYGSTYKIRWTSKETGDINFKVSLENLAQGDDISNPIEAQLGDNTLPSDGTKYYLYKATAAGKLQVTVPDGVTVSFPKSEYTYQGSYETTVTGNTYAISAEAGTDYRMIFSNAVKGGVFTVSYGEWKPGEAASCPLEVSDGSYTLGKDVTSKLWLKYTVKKDGILTIDASAIPYDYSNNISYCPESNQQNLQSVYTYTDGQSIYKTSFSASAGDTYLVQVKLTQAYEGKQILFVERDAEAGETVSNPLVLIPGETLQVPEASTNKPVWIKMTLQPGEVKFTADGYFSAYLYKGEENAKNDYMGSYFRMDQIGGGQGSTTAQFERTQTVTSADAGDYYLKVQSGNSFNFKATGEGIATGIHAVNSQDKAYPVAYYDLNGVKRQTPQTGINLVKMSNGKIVKMVIGK